MRIPLAIPIALALPAPPAGAAEGPEAKAVAYLAAEVPRWRAENGCASCHHNGDGARALFRSIAIGLDVPAEATGDSIRWLSRPESWDDNGGDGAFSDKRLARIQFASALAGAVQAGLVADAAPLDRAADRLASDQHPDGSWPLDGPDTLGSPATYGRSLATLAARDALRAADPGRHRDRIRAADAWLRSRAIRTVMDASVELLRREDHPDAEAADRRASALELLRSSQSSDGGWGPFATSPPEVFDTALAVLALSRLPGDEARALALRGRAFLIASQLPSGGWVETTRPSGNESDAQHTSTTAWATLALLESAPLARPLPDDPPD